MLHAKKKFTHVYRVFKITPTVKLSAPGLHLEGETYGEGNIKKSTNKTAKLTKNWIIDFMHHLGANLFTMYYSRYGPSRDRVVARIRV